jgi:hypothetical protein
MTKSSVRQLRRYSHTGGDEEQPGPIDILVAMHVEKHTYRKNASRKYQPAIFPELITLFRPERTTQPSGEKK